LPKFTESPRFLLQEFFDVLNGVLYINDSDFLDDIEALSASYFDLVVEKKYENNTTYTELYSIPFAPINPSYNDNFFYVNRLNTLETSATSAIEIDDESTVYLRKSSIYDETRTDGNNSYNAISFDSYLRIRSDIEPDTLDFVNTEKPFLYLGKIYSEDCPYTTYGTFHYGTYWFGRSNNYRIEYYGMDRYVLNCLPIHLQTDNIKEFFDIYFDKIHNKIYNKKKNVITLLDALEIDLNFITYLAGLYNIELNKEYLDSLFVDQNSQETRLKERRMREYVRELPNFLKKKGTYSSLYTIFKNFFWNTTDKISIYERWHNEDICNGYPENPNALPQVPLNHFVDINYLNYYGDTPNTCVSAGYHSLINAGGYPVPLSNCYIHTQRLPNSSWLIMHNLETRFPLIRCYDENFNLIIPTNIESLQNYLVRITFNSNYKGTALLILPESSTVESDPVSATYAGWFDSPGWLVDPGWFVSEETLNNFIEHDLDTLTPIVGAYDTVDYTAINLLNYSISPSGFGGMLFGTAYLDDMMVIAVSGNYLHTQKYPDTHWTIEHNLDSRAVALDFYCTRPVDEWRISHNLDTESLIVQTFDSNGNIIYPIAIIIVNSKMLVIKFARPEKGFVSLLVTNETISLPASSTWFFSTALSGHYLSNYIYHGENVILDYLTEDSYGGAGNIKVTTSMPISGVFNGKIPDYTQKIIEKSNIWNIEHNLGQKEVIAQFYISDSNNIWEIGDLYDNSIVKCFDSDRYQIYPDNFSCQHEKYYLSFPENVSGFMVICRADQVFESVSPSARWDINTTPIIKVRNDVISQYQTYSPKSVFIPENIEIREGGETLIVTLSSPDAGYGMIIRGNYLHHQEEYSTKWWVEHNLDTYEIIYSVYSHLIEGNSWLLRHNIENTLVACYDYNRNKLTPNNINNDGNTITIDFISSTSGFVCIQPGTTVTQAVTASTWNVAHNIGNKLSISQYYDDNNNMISPSAIQLINHNNLQASFITPVAGKCICVPPDYLHVQSIPTSAWNITHNLGKPGIITQAFNNSFVVMEPDSVEIIDDISCRAVFSYPVSGYLSVKGIYPTLFEIDPPHCRLYNKNWLEIIHDKPINGYVSVKIADDLIITPVTKERPNTMSLTSSADFVATFATSGNIGYALVSIADTTAKHIYRAEPDNVIIYDQDTNIATFSTSADGYAVVKEIGQLTYGGNLIQSPHYKVEIDVNCEPLSNPDILKSDTLEILLDNWELARPVSKFSHYNILVSPKTDFSGNEIDLYDNQYDYSGIYTRCCLDTTTSSAGYVYTRLDPTMKWNIIHNLNTRNILVQCYDMNNDLLYPANVIIINENEVNIEFYSNQAGRVFIKKSQYNFVNLDEAGDILPEYGEIEYGGSFFGDNDNWVMPHNLNKVLVFADHYFYNYKQILPDTVRADTANIISTNWYVPTLGYCNIRDYEYLHVQSVSADTWEVEHNLEHYGVFVDCFDGDHNRILPLNIKLYNHEKKCTITFSESLSGYAIVTDVGSPFTTQYLVDSFANGGYIKVGDGENTDTWDAEANNSIVDITPLLGNNLSVTEDGGHYYIKGNVREHFTAKSITEMGLFTANNDLAFYTYVKPDSELYKSDRTDLTILYRINKL